MLEANDRNEIRSIIREYMTGTELKSLFENQYRTMLSPQVYGASISYDAATNPAPSTGGLYSWNGTFPLGESIFDNDGFVTQTASGQARLVVPPSLGGLYLIFADVTIEPQPAPYGPGTAATNVVLSIEINPPVGAAGFVPLTRSTGSSSAGQPSLHDSAFGFENLSTGTEVYLKFGSSFATEWWRSFPYQNRLTMLRIPFGTVR